jgi:hypothetical protein
VAGEDVFVGCDAVADRESDLAGVAGQIGWRDALWRARTLQSSAELQ